MKQEQLQQAQHLYFQTDLSKSEIASMIGVSRRTLHYWAQYNQWERIKKSAAHMPSQLAENCYFIMAKMQQIMLTEGREESITAHEVNALYKLTLTISKLQKRSPLNETLELGTRFMEFVDQQNPEAADFIKPYIDGYIVDRAKDQSRQSASLRQKPQAPLAAKEQDDIEAQLDLEDLRYWTENPVPNERIENDDAASAPVSQSSAACKAPADAASSPSSSQSINLPKNEKSLNRAQRRQLARSRQAA